MKAVKAPQAVGILFCVYGRKLSVEIFNNFLSETLQQNHELTHSCNVRCSKKLHFEAVTLPEIQSAESHVIVCYRLSLMKQLLITNWCLNGGLNSVLYISDGCDIKVRYSKLGSACVVVVFAAIVHVKIHHGCGSSFSLMFSLLAKTLVNKVSLEIPTIFD